MIAPSILFGSIRLGSVIGRSRMSGRYAYTRKLIRASGHLLRAVLLCVALLALSVYLIWSLNPSLIDKADAYIVERHFGQYARSLSNARALLAESRLDEAKVVLDSLLKDLGEVKKQDRRAQYYAEAEDLLLYISSRNGDHAASLAAARKLTEFDPNHYNHWLNLAYMLNSGGERTKAIDALRKAFRIAPASIQTAEPLSTLLFEEGKKDEAREVIKGFLAANRGGSVAVLHAGEGKEFSPDKTSRLISLAFTGKTERLRLPVGSSGVERLRVELPQLPDLNVRVDSIALATETGSESIDFRTLDYGLHDLSEDREGILTVTGTRPYIEFKLPAHLKEARIISIDLDASFFQRESAGITNLKRVLGIDA